MSVSAPTRAPRPGKKALDASGVGSLLTYAAYLASPEEMARYDILDGQKIYRVYGEKALANPTRDHQTVQGEIFVALRAYARMIGTSKALMAPCDVLIRRSPLRTRQPDVLLISAERLAQNPPSSDPAPLSPGPELAIEILSPSDTRRVQSAKLTDYATVDVRERWLVSLEAATVEVLQNAEGEWATIGLYRLGETVLSSAFPSLTASVDDMFAS